ncbi:hypothetical protein SAMN06273572_10940 [Monaibacterium marinum]|uniref:Pyridine nucleotide-disulphide oxidoreductase n=1 Tax=Pontivivens marinum TaxID=1690039 RepID=A0A2C9CUT7_9RHOB|nr:NAD(P)/FAD-dependent oxidoreductase [Monaibacterium marinum]SOH95281.1 hypothetical protein SAMN06273572_10940 [Monaibacterium marinum]
MTITKIDTDYLIVGSGAVGMAFADILLAETDARITIVDRYHAPGGHWNVAYPFVTLHQPSAFYGVSSRELSRGTIDTVGLNQGLNDLASGAEVSAYFDAVMREQFLPSGRVQYFPMCDYIGDGQFTARLTGAQYQVTAAKTVDATYLNTSTPSTHIPNFSIDAGVQFIPVNDLPKVTDAPEGFVIIGGGKTGIDACLWLLQQGVDADDIRWIMPRDAWLLDRKNTQPTQEFFAASIGSQANQFEAIAAADSVDDMFDRLESCGYFLRIDPQVRPAMFHGATISALELEQLRRIKNIVRMGRVTYLGADQITLEHGAIPTGAGIVHVDCSASAITNLETKPVFQGDLITPQTVRPYQPVFSAAFIAHVEARYATQVEKNRLCAVVPLPNHDTDFLRYTTGFMMNQFNWGQDKDLRAWLKSNRLDGFSSLTSGIPETAVEKRAIMARIKAAAMPAMGKLQTFIVDMDKAEGN